MPNANLEHEARPRKRRLPPRSEREWLVIEATYYVDRLLDVLAHLEVLDRRAA